MKAYKNIFRGKRITMLGLGVLGRGLNDAKFLARCGARLTITDLKTRAELSRALAELKPYKNITYVLGGHRLEDFRNCDMVLRAARVPLNSPFLAEARKHRIPVEMDASLFAKLAEGVTLIGVTGTRGKSTTTHLIYHILKRAKKRVHLGGNVRGIATLPLLARIQKGDCVVLELDSWQLQGFGDVHVSPSIAVFTNFLDDHLDYYAGSRAAYFRDKANIFRFQKKNDVLIAGCSLKTTLVKKFPEFGGRALYADHTTIPKRWQLRVLGDHFRDNAALALRVGAALKIPRAVVREAIEAFKGMPGRLEYVKKINGVAVYNDTCATTPDATIAGLSALGKKKNVVLIMGGHDKQLSMEKLIQILPVFCRAVVLLDGSGTEKIRAAVERIPSLPVTHVPTLSRAVSSGFSLARRGDVLLFSPAFASFGMFKNEYDRGDQFLKLLRLYH